MSTEPKIAANALIKVAKIKVTETKARGQLTRNITIEFSEHEEDYDQEVKNCQDCYTESIASITYINIILLS